MDIINSICTLCEITWTKYVICFPPDMLSHLMQLFIQCVSKSAVGVCKLQCLTDEDVVMAWNAFLK